jgi:hypothetical protein
LRGSKCIIFCFNFRLLAKFLSDNGYRDFSEDLEMTSKGCLDEQFIAIIHYCHFEPLLARNPSELCWIKSLPTGRKFHCSVAVGILHFVQYDKATLLAKLRIDVL